MNNENFILNKEEIISKLRTRITDEAFLKKLSNYKREGNFIKNLFSIDQQILAELDIAQVKVFHSLKAFEERIK